MCEYSNGKNFDQKLLFMCRSLDKDIEILKRKWKSTYSSLPWEEIEFIIVAFVISETKREKINLFYLMTLRDNVFFKHLTYFGSKLESSSKEIVLNKYEITDLPRIHRHILTERLKESDVQYAELLHDFETTRDAYSFKKIIEAIDFVISVDPKDDNAPMVLFFFF